MISDQIICVVFILLMLQVSYYYGLIGFVFQWCKDMKKLRELRHSLKEIHFAIQTVRNTIRYQGQVVMYFGNVKILNRKALSILICQMKYVECEIENLHNKVACIRKKKKKKGKDVKIVEKKAKRGKSLRRKVRYNFKGTGKRRWKKIIDTTSWKKTNIEIKKYNDVVALQEESQEQLKNQWEEYILALEKQKTCSRCKKGTCTKKHSFVVKPKREIKKSV